MNDMTPVSLAVTDLEDRVGVVTIPAAELQRIYDDVSRENIRIARRDRRRRLTNGGITITSLAALAALASTVTVMLPLKELVPLPVYQRDDGTYTNYIRWTDLPEQVRNNTAVNAFWGYVQQRESWSEANAAYAWTLVSAMSAPKVRTQFQSWFQRDNPESPARTYKDGTTVEARFVRWENVCPPEGCPDGQAAYRFWFDRIETAPGALPKKPVRYAVTVRGLLNVPMPADRQWQRWTFNAPQIQVIDYPGAQREGVAQ